jgi:hypothetical protein
VGDETEARVGTGQSVGARIDQVVSQLLGDRGIPVPGDRALLEIFVVGDHVHTVAKRAAYGLDGR